MAFRIEISSKAADDIDVAFEFIAADSVQHAQRWLHRLQVAIISIRTMPYRHPLIPESEWLSRELRLFPHASHRVVYEVNGPQNVVVIVRIYHVARRALRGTDLE